MFRVKIDMEVPSTMGMPEPRGKSLKTPRIRIEVTQEHIDQAIPKNSHRCMIARAILASVPEARQPLVDLHTMRWSDPVKHLRYIYPTPRAARLALHAFDFGIKPQPFSFISQGGQVVSTRTSFRDPDGKIRQRLFHTFGQRKVNAARKDGTQKTGHPDIIGGNRPPIGPLASKDTAAARRTMAASQRTFGEHRLSLPDVFGAGVISDDTVRMMKELAAELAAEIEALQAQQRKTDPA